MAHLVRESQLAWDVAVIGCGYSGTAVIAHLVKGLPQQSRICVFDPSRALGLGPAYSTSRPEHLLNVRANRMGLNAPEDFYTWCQSEHGTRVLRAAGIEHPDPEAFLPRMVYGAYLKQCWAETVETAAERGITLHVIAANVIHIDEAMHIHTNDHGHFTAQHIVCSSGTSLHDTSLWNADFESLARQRRPLRVIGSGLSAVDVVLSLANAGYDHPIPCISRHGKWPEIHSSATTIPTITLAETNRLSVLMHAVRTAINAQKTVHWQNMLDALRPQTSRLWNALPDATQRRFFQRYFSLWNRFRHRMPPQVAGVIHGLEQKGQLTLTRARASESKHKDDTFVFDCRGPYYGALPEYIQPLIANRTLKRHASGAGLVSTKEGIVGQSNGITLYAMGALLLGQWLETTAVPELREQARSISDAIASHYPH